jgi:hypothetical protein
LIVTVGLVVNVGCGEFVGSGAVGAGVGGIGAVVGCVVAGGGLAGIGDAVLDEQAAAVKTIKQTPSDREDRIADYSSGTTVTVAASVLVTHSSWSRMSIRRGLWPTVIGSSRALAAVSIWAI